MDSIGFPSQFNDEIGRLGEHELAEQSMHTIRQLRRDNPMMQEFETFKR